MPCNVCINASETFNYAVGSMYARHVFDIEAKRQVDDMTGYIRKAFNEILQNLDWMDKDTKNEAFIKLEKLHQTLAYPVEYLNRKKIDGIHKGLLISENDYLGTIEGLRDIKPDTLECNRQKPAIPFKLGVQLFYEKSPLADIGVS